MAKYREDDRVCEEAGVITHDEAQEILGRFNASHFHQHDHEHARYTIPADPRRDDDIRLGVYISQQERSDAELQAARSVVLAARAEWASWLGHSLQWTPTQRVLFEAICAHEAATRRGGK